MLNLHLFKNNSFLFHRKYASFNSKSSVNANLSNLRVLHQAEQIMNIGSFMFLAKSNKSSSNDQHTLGYIDISIS